METKPDFRFSSNLTELPLLTAVVPVGAMYGRTSRLLAWVKQIQQFNCEVILVIDEKLDGTYQEIYENISTMELTGPLTMVHGRFGGPGPARNAGIERAKGEWIAFWDSDDSPNIVGVLSTLQNIPSDVEIIVGRYSIKSQNSEKQRGSRKAINFALNPGLWRVIFRSEIIKDKAFPNLRMAEDQVFLLNSDIFTRKIHFTKENLYQYYVEVENQLTKDNRYLEDMLVASDIIKKELSKDTSSIHEKFLISTIVFRINAAFFKRVNMRRRYKFVLSNLNFINLKISIYTIFALLMSAKNL